MDKRKRWFIDLFRSSAWVLLLGSSLAFAQEQSEKQQLVSLAHLPGIERLRQNPRWTDEDTRVATNLVRKYLSETDQEFPTDCRFDLSEAENGNYQLSEERLTIENKLRRMKVPMVMFEQSGIWESYHAPENFKPLHPDNPEWDQFVKAELPLIDKELREQYAVPPPYGPRGLTEIRFAGYANICDDIQRYLAATYKVYPSSKVVCGTQLGSEATSFHGAIPFSISNYKLSYPYAYGYRYRLLSVRSCVFPSKGREIEKMLAEDINQQEGRQSKQQTIFGKIKSGNEDSVRERRRANRREDQEIAKENREQRARDKQESAENAASIKKLEAYRKSLEPIWLSQDDGNEAPLAHSVVGTEMARAYGKVNKHEFDVSAQFTKDETVLIELQKKILESETQFQDTVNRKNGISDVVQAVELDPSEPFNIAEIPLDTPFNTAALLNLTKVFNGQKDNGWLFGCRGYTLVQIQDDEQRTQYPKRSYLRCLVPHFIVKIKSSEPQYRYVKIPYPALISGVTEVKNQCHVMVGQKDSTHFGFKTFNLFRIKKNPMKTTDAFTFHSLLKLPVELPMSGGIKGRILDLITKLPIEGAEAKIYPALGPLNMNTDKEGAYQFNQFPDRGLRMEVEGNHRKYQPGVGPITNLRLGELAVEPDFYLDPIRVKVTGNVQETFHPRFGTGLKGLRVAFVGFEKQFYAFTDAQGHFEMDNVPDSLSKLYVTDLKRGHEDGTLTVELEPHQNFTHADFKILPRVTSITGRVTIPNGRPVRGLTVRLDAYPAFTTVTNNNGEYSFVDIPVNQTSITVVGDSEKIYISKTLDLASIPPYEHTIRDFVLRYTRSDVSGRVTDILEKRPLSGIPVWVDGAKERYHATTDENGNYKIVEVPDTAKVLRLATPGNKYVDRPRTIDPSPQPGVDITKQNFNLVPKGYTKDKIVFVITWNDRQWDLDSQLFLPDEQHLFFKTIGNGSIQSAGGANLDHDDTGSGGRETTTLTLLEGKVKMNGTYAFLIYQYVDNHLKFTEADTVVEVYRDDTFDKEIIPGPYSGRLWYVADVHGGEVSEVNKFPVDVESQMRDVAQSVHQKEIEAQDLKNSLKDDARAIKNMEDQHKHDLVDLPATEKKLAAMDPKKDATEFTVMKIRYDDLKKRVLNYENDLMAAKDALAKKTERASHADEDVANYRQNAQGKTQQLQQNLASSIRNMSNYR